MQNPARPRTVKGGTARSRLRCSTVPGASGLAELCVSGLGFNSSASGSHTAIETVPVCVLRAA
jgi:hypothetical protein